MIEKRSKADVPGIQQPIKRRRPESAFAKRQVAEFLASGCDRPRSVRVMRRGSRLFLMVEEVALELYRDGPRRADPVA